MCVNKPFKAAIERLATKHMQENLEAYVRGELNASARRVLFTKWVGQAWEEVSSNKDMVVRSFQKVGIAVAVDGSEDSLIHIEGLENYRIEDTDEEDTDEDPFGDSDEDPDEDPDITSGDEDAPTESHVSDDSED